MSPIFCYFKAVELLTLKVLCLVLVSFGSSLSQHGEQNMSVSSVSRYYHAGGLSERTIGVIEKESKLFLSQEEKSEFTSHNSGTKEVEKLHSNRSSSSMKDAKRLTRGHSQSRRARRYHTAASTHSLLL
jgi:hypothetical protein